MTTVRDIIRTIEETYPLSRAEAWDKVGLQIGSSGTEVRRVAVAHEVTANTLHKAQGSTLLVVYHPLILRPLETLDFSSHTVRLAAHCISEAIHVVALHTALDNAPSPHALGDKLAESLGLKDIVPLKPSGREALFKIAVFVPLEALDKVSAALWEAGAGQIGNYDEAGFRMRGTGTFRPLPGANPYSGAVGQREEADEWRLEVIVPAARRDAAIRAMNAAHPYEEVAYDVYPLHNTGAPYGAARMGELVGEPVPLAAYAAHVQTALAAPNLRVVEGGATVRRVACVPGSGASYINAAAAAGCDCLVTGDIKHHDALQARALGLSLIDATHTATERAAVPMIAAALAGLPDIECVTCDDDTNPFS